MENQQTTNSEDNSSSSNPNYDVSGSTNAYGQPSSSYSIPSDSPNINIGQNTSNPNLVKGIIFGLIAAIIGAAVWALITTLTGYQIGYMAIGVGFLVGLAVNMGGQGSEIQFGIVGLVLAVLGCALGNYLTIIGVASKELGIGFFEVYNSLGALIWPMFKENIGVMDLLFYGIAAYAGFNYSIAGQRHE